MTATPWDALLTTRRRVVFDRCEEAAPLSSTSKAGQVRALLRRNGFTVERFP